MREVLRPCSERGGNVEGTESDLEVTPVLPMRYEGWKVGRVRVM